MKSISDKAEVSVDFPDKTYMGSFGRESSFDVKVEPDEVLLRLVRAGEERREIAVHLHYYLLADLLTVLLTPKLRTTRRVKLIQRNRRGIQSWWRRPAAKAP